MIVSPLAAVLGRSMFIGLAVLSVPDALQRFVLAVNLHTI
jgi:hypothetical protein